MNIITSEHVPPGQAFLINRNWVHSYDLGPLDTRRWPRFLAFILGRPAPRLPYRFMPKARTGAERYLKGRRGDADYELAYQAQIRVWA